MGRHQEEWVDVIVLILLGSGFELRGGVRFFVGGFLFRFFLAALLCCCVAAVPAVLLFPSHPAVLLAFCSAFLLC